MILLAKLNISSYYTPASECGGDWWGYFSVGDVDYVYVAGMVGHGVSAALTAMAFASFGTMEQGSGITEDDSPADILGKFMSLYKATKAENSMTFRDENRSQEKDYNFCKCWTHLPALVTSSASDERLKKKKTLY